MKNIDRCGVDSNETASRKTQSLSRFHPMNHRAESPAASEPVDQSKPPAALESPAIEPVAVPASKPEGAVRRSARKGPSEKLAALPARKPAPPVADASEPVDGAKSMLELLDRDLPLTARHGLLVSFAMVAGLLVSFLFGQVIGREEAVRAASLAISPKNVPAEELPADALPRLDAALALLRDGRSSEALDALKVLISGFPKASSLSYAAAIAALQAGYPAEAERLTDRSITMTSRVSDALALKAAIAAAQSGRPGKDQEDLLRAAIAADPMNPNPFLELASLMRYRGQHEEARQLLVSASLRMNPADSRIVLDTTLALMSVDSATAPANPAATGVPEKDFPAALSELRVGNYRQAAEILRSTRQSLPPDLFAYLINDPALRKFSDRPELAGLY